MMVVVIMRAIISSIHVTAAHRSTQHDYQSNKKKVFLFHDFNFKGFKKLRFLFDRF